MKISLENTRKIAKKLNIIFDKFDIEQFQAGINAELNEHGSKNSKTNVINDNPILAAKIALGHLNEFPDYYTRLKKMEDEAKLQLKNEMKIRKQQLIKLIQEQINNQKPSRQINERRDYTITPEIKKQLLALKKTAKSLKFPNFILRPNFSYISWKNYTDVGYNAINRVRKEAERLKWKHPVNTSSTHVANDSVNDQDIFIDPTNTYSLEIYSYLGVGGTNSFSLKLAIRGGIKYPELNEQINNQKPTRQFIIKKIKDYISHFPNTTKSWALATDEVPSMHNHAAEFFDNYKGNIFRSFGGTLPDEIKKDPGLRNMTHKLAILKLIDRMNDNQLIDFYNSWFEIDENKK